MSFAVNRKDGRSNAQVLVDLVTKMDPGSVLGFATLTVEFERDCESEFPKDRIIAIVNRTQRRLLRECCRRLQSVHNVGYRVAEAKDHRAISLLDKKRSDRQLTKGLLTLQHVNWDEMDANQRRAHEGQLMVMEALVSNQMALNRRMDKIERLIQDSLHPKE